MHEISARRMARQRFAVLALGGAIATGAVLAGPASAERGGAAPSGIAAKTRAISGFDNSVILGPGAPPVVMRLNVPAGEYAVNAKVTARLAGGASEETVNCRLVVADGFDEADLTISQLLNLQTMALQVVDELTSPRAINLVCDKSKDASTIELTFVKLTALKVHSTSVVPLDID